MTQALATLERLKQEFGRLTGQPASSDANLPSVPGQGDPRAPRGYGPSATYLVRAGLVVIFGFFGFLGAWAYFSPIESAAISYGVILAEGNRKAVQHLDGGIVRAITVKEGELVRAGQELIRLDTVQAQASLEIQATGVASLSAAIARLEAEAQGAETIAFPEALRIRREDPAVAALLASQQQLFDARRSAIAAQITTLGEQIKQSRSQIEIYRGQMETAANQHRMITDELGPKEMLYEKGYATNSPVLQLKRAATALLGQKEEYAGNIKRLEHLVSQLESQISQAESDFKMRVAQDLADTRNRLAEAQERQRVAQDILDRTVIRAPATGRVLGLTVNTPGAVVGKGEKLLEVVPENAGFAIKARFKPADAIEIHPGMQAELRILSSEGRRLPLIYGQVKNRSADARADAQSQAPFYDVDIDFDEHELATLQGANPTPGTPVEVVIPTGSRTVLAYMLEPMSESLRHGLREK